MAMSKSSQIMISTTTYYLIRFRLRKDSSSSAVLSGIPKALAHLMHGGPFGRNSDLNSALMDRRVGLTGTGYRRSLPQRRDQTYNLLSNLPRSPCQRQRAHPQFACRQS